MVEMSSPQIQKASSNVRRSGLTSRWRLIAEVRVARANDRFSSRIPAQLDHLNINESTAFPCIENSAKYIAQKYAFGK